MRITRAGKEMLKTRGYRGSALDEILSITQEEAGPVAAGFFAVTTIEESRGVFSDMAVNDIHP